MEQMITMSINLHLLMIGATILLALYTIFVSNKIKDETAYINRIKYTQPQYLSLVSAVAFTGIIVMAVNHFTLKPSLILMVITVLIVFFTSIKLHMQRKQVNTTDISQISDLKKAVKKKYIVDVVLIVLVGAVSFML